MKIINLGMQDYLIIWEKMKCFTKNRNYNSEDELWIVEHPSVFTKGISARAKELLSTSNIPVVNTDRGGQITYHGPGQLIIYCLIDLIRSGIGVKKMVTIMENSVIDLLYSYNICAHLKKSAPGVYVDNDKIAALGLKITRGRAYHGLSLNVDMDLSPFMQIDICGYKGLQATQLSDLTNVDISLASVANKLSKNIMNYVIKNSNRTIKG